jgi:hypothetical protein
MNPTKSRSDELPSLGRRSVAAVDAAAPSVDAGFDVTDWDQVLISVSGNAVGTAELLLYFQFRGFIGATEGPAMVPATYFRSVPLLNHTSTFRGGAVYVVNTVKCDRVFPAIITFSGATAVYVNVMGLPRRGAPLAASPSAEGEEDADVFDPVDIVKVGGQTLAAHGAAATTVPVLVGAKATAAEPAAVDEADAALMSVTLAGRLRVDAVGNVADDTVDSGNPVKVGAIADQVVSAVADGDRVNLTTTLNRELRVCTTAFDSISGTDRGSVNTTADDRDEAAQPVANDTLAAITPVYYPSSAGLEIGNRPWLTIQIGIRDGTLTFESSNDGASWADVTKMIVDRNLGYGGFASWISPDVATVYYQLEVMCGARYLRALWTPADATSIVIIYVMARAGD